MASQLTAVTVIDSLEVNSVWSSRTDLNFLKFFINTVDRDQTVSRRSKPSSRTALTGEQPDPWKRLHLQDAMSRHRGAKRIRR